MMKLTRLPHKLGQSLYLLDNGTLQLFIEEFSATRLTSNFPISGLVK